MKTLFRGIALGLLLATASAASAAEETIWVEAEDMTGIRGYCFPDLQDSRATPTRGNWAYSGPGIAPEWTQGGESGWLSIACSPHDARAEAAFDFEVPRTATYHVWVRYRDWRHQTERFQLVIEQDHKAAATLVFGEKPAVDEDDELKVFWNWAFAWDRREASLTQGPARLLLQSHFDEPVHKQVDAICLTTDAAYRPEHREKPMLPAWRVMEDIRAKGLDTLKPLAASVAARAPKPVNAFSKHCPIYPWNVRQEWLKQLGQTQHVGTFPVWNVDPAWQKLFLDKYGTVPDMPIFSSPGVGPSPQVEALASLLKDNTPFVRWLQAHPDQPWAMLSNYGYQLPVATPDATANFKRYRDRFVGFIAGECAVDYMDSDAEDIAQVNKQVKTATSRRQVYQILTDVYMPAVAKKYDRLFGEKWPDPYREVIPCLSAGMTAFVFPELEWGARMVGFENFAGCSCTGMRLAFLRGGAREYDRMFGSYRSCNFGDAATIFSNIGAYPGPRYVYDNSYDPWAGAGMTWLKMDIWLQYMQGSAMSYNEEGFDEFWAPGGGSAGQKEIQLSPKGRLEEEFMAISRRHPDRGTPCTPMALLVDLAHGWDPNNNQPGAFNWTLTPEVNEKLLKYGAHERMLQEWFRLAYYPYPIAEASIATGVTQNFVDSVLGDSFDVLATASDPKRAAVLGSYSVVILVGEVELSEAWGRALADYLRKGGTLLATRDQLSGPGAAFLELPNLGKPQEADRFTWALDGKTYESQRFHYSPIEGGEPLATAENGQVLAAGFPRGAGKLIYLSAPKGLGIDRNAIPAVSLLLAHLRAGQMPVEVKGGVEWCLNKTAKGWIVTLLNPHGCDKPQHGMTPTRYAERREVSIQANDPLQKVTEWFADENIPPQQENGHSAVRLIVPAGGVRIVELEIR